LVKSPELLPAAATEEIVSAPIPLFVTVIIMGALEAPWLVAGKVTETDESVTEGFGGVVGGAE
jgi:hypothetical protein